MRCCTVLLRACAPPTAHSPAAPPPLRLPPPQGVTSKDRAILKMRAVNFKYPTAETRILNDVNVQVSLNSRVAVLGPNGAGKSTMIKVRGGGRVAGGWAGCRRC